MPNALFRSLPVRASGAVIFGIFEKELEQLEARGI